MRAVHVSTDGDVLDAVLAAHYGPARAPALLPAVLAANPGLSARPLSLPAGVEVRLPAVPDEMAPAAASRGVVRIWGTT